MQTQDVMISDDMRDTVRARLARLLVPLGDCLIARHGHRIILPLGSAKRRVAVARAVHALVIGGSTPTYLRSRCGTPGCVHPLHCAAQPGTARLDRSDVLSIRRLHWIRGVSQTELARRFGVSQPTINAVVQRKAWSNVEPIEGELRAIDRRRRNRAGIVETVPECLEPVDTGTGRIVGPDGAVYADIRAAVAGSGVERGVIAAALNSPVCGDWSYEQGSMDPPALVAYAEGLDWDELRW